MQKKFEINWTNIKGDCQSGRKVVIHNSKGDLPLTNYKVPFSHCFNYQNSNKNLKKNNGNKFNGSRFEEVTYRSVFE